MQAAAAADISNVASQTQEQTYSQPTEEIQERSSFSMPGLSNNAVMQDLQNSVCILNGGQAMRNDQHSVVTHHSVQRFLHHSFAIRI